MMSTITHVFFDLHGTLIDSINRLPPCYQEALGRWMAARYGGDPAEWAEANRLILEDWASYVADLDLSGDDGLDQFWEAETRKLRAMFRLTERPYPPPEEMRHLVQAHHYPATSRCDALYPDAREALAAIHEVDDLPLILGVITHAVTGHAEGLLNGAGVRAWFTGPIVTSDVAGHFDKDADFLRLAFLRAGAAPAQCAIVEDVPQHVQVAVRLGARAVLIDRTGRYSPPDGAVMLPDLLELPGLLRRWMMEGRTADD